MLSLIFCAVFLAAAGHSSAVPVCKVGLVAPFNGTLGYLGQAIRQGVDMAAAEYDTIEFEVIGYESECTAAGAVAGIAAFKAAGVPAVIGDVCSSATLAASVPANADKIVMISPASTSALLTAGGGPYFFRTVASDNFQASFLASFITAGNAKAVKVAVIYSLEAYGEGLFNSLFTVSGSSSVGSVTNLTVVSSLGFPSGNWANGSLSGLLAQKPDAVLFFTSDSSGATAAATQIRASNFTGRFYTSDGLAGSGALISGSGAVVWKGTLSTTPYLGTPAFKAAYVAKYNVTVPQYAAQAYDALRALSVTCVTKKRQPATGAQIQAALSAKSFKLKDAASVVGTLRFDSDGDLLAKGIVYSVLEVVNGTWVTLS